MIAAGLALALAIAVPGDADLARRLTLLAREDARVLAVFERLAAVATCREKGFRTGMVLHDLDQYAPSARSVAARLFALDPGRVAIAATAPGGAADRAGLRAGDGLRRVAGVAAATSAAAARAQIAAAGPIALLTVDRGAVSIDAELRPAAGCAVEARLVPDEALEARAGEGRVRVTTALVEATRDDDELAFVLAHELAHLAGDDPGTTAREREAAADARGLAWVAAAGFATEAAAPLVLRLAKARGAYLDPHHPGARARARALAARAAELRRAR